MNLIDFVCIVATNGIGKMKHQVVSEELHRERRKKKLRKEIKWRILVIETRAARET